MDGCKPESAPVEALSTSPRGRQNPFNGRNAHLRLGAHGCAKSECGYAIESFPPKGDLDGVTNVFHR
ncbi:unnamed protein product, partial [Iphiclides podalirius]